MNGRARRGPPARNHLGGLRATAPEAWLVRIETAALTYLNPLLNANYGVLSASRRTPS
jgi:hypothetical protein